MDRIFDVYEHRVLYTVRTTTHHITVSVKFHVEENIGINLINYEFLSRDFNNKNK